MMTDEKIGNLIRERMIAISENDFVKTVYEKDMVEPLEILNWYRNLYHKEGSNTERGLMAETINDLFMQYKIELR